MKKIFGSIIYIFRNYKSKIVFFCISILVFLLLLFPYNDLGDLITTKISDLTHNQLFIQFQSIGFSIIPKPALELSDVNLQASSFSPLKINKLLLAPSFSSMLAFRLGGNVIMEGLFKGNADITLENGSVKLDVNSINLSELAEFLALSLPLKGQVFGKTNIKFDPSLQTQPNGDFQFQIKKLQMPSSTQNTMLGPLVLPELSFTKIILEGDIKDGHLRLKKIQLGEKVDELFVSINGEIALKLVPKGAGMTVSPGQYNLQIQLIAKKEFIEKTALFLSFIDAFKQSTLDGARYDFSLSGTDFTMPPKIAPIEQSTKDNQETLQDLKDK